MFFLVVYCQSKDNKTQNICLFITLLTWGVIFGLRAFDVGNDSPMYYNFYSGYYVKGLGTYEIDSESTEIGFTMVANTLHKISGDVTFFFSVVAISAFIYLYPLYRNKITGLWGLLCFFLMSASFASYIIAMRQSMSIIFILMALFIFSKMDVKNISSNAVCYNGNTANRFQIIIANCYNKYIIIGTLLCIFAISIHRTTVILLPVLLVCYLFRFGKNIAYLTIVFVFIFTVFFSNSIGVFFDYALSLVGAYSDDNVNMLSDRYAADFGKSSMTLLKVLSWCVPMAVTVRYTSEEKIHSFQFSCLMVGFILYILFGSATMCIRMSMLFQIIGFAMFIPESVNDNARLKSIYIMFTLLFFYSAYQTYARWIPNPYDSTLPFYFFWEQH